MVTAPTDEIGFATKWQQFTVVDESQVLDDCRLWRTLFVFGGKPGVDEVMFGGQRQDPEVLGGYFLGKQQDGDTSAGGTELAATAPEADRCVLCRHEFGTWYEDGFFGRIRIERNRQNRYYCTQCDFFIRACPGETTLVMPVLVVDVKHSREIRAEVGLTAYVRLLRTFRRQVAGEIQRHLGFILNTGGDSVIAVWPSGFLPQAIKDERDWDEQFPARIPTQFALEAAGALVTLSPDEFDGSRLPFRGALDTSEILIFAVTHEEDLDFATGSEDMYVSGPSEAGSPQSMPTGPVAVDIAGDAIETASELASADEVDAGEILVTRRTDQEAARRGPERDVDMASASGDPTRVIRAIEA